MVYASVLYYLRFLLSVYTADLNDIVHFMYCVIIKI